MKWLYLAFIISAVYLFHGCSVTTPLLTVDMVDTRKIVIDRNGTHIELSGDIQPIEDYAELHKLLDRL